MRDEVVAAVASSPSGVVVISGATGCGKTTQVPQFLLDDAVSRGAPCSILVTQPRRISAITVSERVANERGEEVSDFLERACLLDLDRFACVDLRTADPI